MSGENSPSRKMMDGLRAVYSLSRVHVLREWVWDNSVQKWVLHAKLNIRSGRPDVVPNETVWYVTVDSAYPLGKIKFYPAVTGGISGTFQHQMYNGETASSGLWRKGYVCLQTSANSLGRRGYDIEPYTAPNRLRWYFERGIEWLESAGNDMLIGEGEHFELPDCAEKGGYTVACWEGSESYELWKIHEGESGLVELETLAQPRNTVAVTVFRDRSGEVIHKVSWGRCRTTNKKERELGLWVLLPRVIVLSPWQVPMNWRELNEAAKEQGIDIRGLIGEVSRGVRDQKRHFALLGYPIPALVGSDPVQIKWQATLLPILCNKRNPPKGFRPNEAGCRMGDRRLLSGGEKIVWEKTENWHPDALLSRGRYSETLTNAKVIVVGGGAIGSIVSEMLARGGVKSITIIDGEDFKAENLVRHTLALDDVNLPKAAGLERKLNGLGPHVSARGIASRIETLDADERKLIDESSVIIDCTGNDEVIHYMEGMNWAEAKLICSVSIGLKARRSYIWIERNGSLSQECFEQAMRPWLEKDRDELGEAEFPRADVGCWHPAFPARVDDIYLGACTAVKYIEENIGIEKGIWRLGVFEQMETDGSFGGIRRVTEVKSCEEL